MKITAEDLYKVCVIEENASAEMDFLGLPVLINLAQIHVLITVNALKDNVIAKKALKELIAQSQFVQMTAVIMEFAVEIRFISVLVMKALQEAIAV